MKRRTALWLAAAAVLLVAGAAAYGIYLRIRPMLHGSTTEFVLPTKTSSGHGTISEFSLGSPPYSITAGPDGALWFIELNSNKIGRIT
jgi:hypothetical protein